MRANSREGYGLSIRTRTIGLIGGLSSETTALYYRNINDQLRRCDLGMQAAKIVLHSLDGDQIADCRRRGAETELVDILHSAALSVRAAGADCIALCADGLQGAAERVANVLPQDAALSLAGDVLGRALRAANHLRVAMIGESADSTEKHDIDSLLHARHGIDCVRPDAAEADALERIISDELPSGILRPDTIQLLRGVIARMMDAKPVDAVVLTTTETTLSLAGRCDELQLPCLSMPTVHAQAIARYVLHDFIWTTPAGKPSEIGEYVFDAL